MYGCNQPLVNEADFWGSEAWAVEQDPSLEFLDGFINIWTGQPLPKYGQEVSEELGRSPEWRQKILRRLFSRHLRISDMTY